MEGHRMKSINGTNPRRELGATTGGTGMAALVVLYIASLSYIALGGPLALEASPIAEPAVSMADIAVKTADVGGARH
jgi:hypothetical protein